MDWAAPRSWRVTECVGAPGLMCYFDPAIEEVQLRYLTKDEKSLTLDKPRSVSGLFRFVDSEEVDGCDTPLGPSRGVPFVFDPRR